MNEDVDVDNSTNRVEQKIGSWSNTFIFFVEEKCDKMIYIIESDTLSVIFLYPQPHFVVQMR